jgi:DNA polymerase III delta subunit
VTKSTAEDRVLERIKGGSSSPLFLVAGESVLAESSGQRIAAALASPLGARVETYRRPADLREIFADLRTFSLFGSAKVILVIESAVLSDRSAAAYLIDQAAEALPLAEGAELRSREREAAGRLLQVLRLFDADGSSASSREILQTLPGWVFEGGSVPGSKRKKRRRPKEQAESLVEQLEALLDLARRENLRGWAETDAADLGTVLKDGFPEGHFLVLCEAAVASDHPVVKSLKKADCLVEVAAVTFDQRGNWSGVNDLVAEFESETKCGIDRDAVEELVRRTLKQEPGWGKGARSARADTTTRFAAEFRKLSLLAADGRITAALVRDAVKDRGEEDLWAILDAVGAGRSDEALSRLRRKIDGAEDSMSERLGFFSQLATFCRHLAAISGMAQATGMPLNERNYNRFKSDLASQLQGPVPGTEVSLLASLHPYRLHRAYLAASRFSSAELRRLPAVVLETEMRLKGESANPDAALAHLVTWLSVATTH